jgi:hypothetical protein
MVLGDNSAEQQSRDVTRDAIASGGFTHNPSENRTGTRSDRAFLREHDSALGSNKIGMVVLHSICSARFTALAINGCERFLLFFYCFACWAAFWLIRATEGPERFFMVGWCTGFVLSPLKLLGLRWAGVIKHIGAVGLAVALLASLALLLKPLDMAHSSSRTDVT